MPPSPRNGLPSQQIPRHNIYLPRIDEDCDELWIVTMNGGEPRVKEPNTSSVERGPYHRGNTAWKSIFTNKPAVYSLSAETVPSYHKDLIEKETRAISNMMNKKESLSRSVVRYDSIETIVRLVRVSDVDGGRTNIYTVYTNVRPLLSLRQPLQLQTLCCMRDRPLFCSNRKKVLVVFPYHRYSHWAKLFKHYYTTNCPTYRGQ
jgi:hypothetical protein